MISEMEKVVGNDFGSGLLVVAGGGGDGRQYSETRRKDAVFYAVILRRNWSSTVLYAVSKLFSRSPPFATRTFQAAPGPQLATRFA